MRAFRPLVLRWRVCSAGCCCGGFAAGALLGGCALWTRVGCMACVSRGCVCPAWCRCGGFGRRCALGLAVPLEFGLGAWPSSRAGALILPGAAAAALPPVRFGVGCAAWVWLGAWPASCVGAFVLPGAAAAALAAGALWGWLCPLGFGWVHGLRLALARLSCRVQLPRFAAGAFLVCFAAIPAGSIAYVGEALSVGIPWLR